MWIQDEIEAHHEWKLKLADYAKNCDKSIAVDNVCFDQKCTLTTHLKALSENFLEMDELVKEHRAFHRVVGELVRNINNGVKIDQEMSFGVLSPFNKHVTNIEKLLNKLSKVTP